MVHNIECNISVAPNVIARTRLSSVVIICKSIFGNPMSAIVDEAFEHASKQ